MRPILLLIILFPFFIIAQSSFERGEKLYHQEHYKEARPLFESFLKENPGHAKTTEYLGDIAAYASEWDTAAAYYKTLLDKNPENANYNFKYGGVLGRKAQSINKFRAALYVSDIKTHLEKAARLDPKHIESRWALVDLYIALPSILGGSEETAKKYANQIMKISEVDGHLIMGHMAEQYNRDAEAERHYKKAIAIGQSPHTYEKLADLYENKTNEPEKSLAVREASAKKHQRNGINYQIGKISGMYNIELEKGLVYLNAFIANHTVKDGVPLSWAYFRKAQIYRHMRDKARAETWINKALALDNDFSEALEEKIIIKSL
ncbi:MAG: tetratricopeptide repeat protein [Flavobacteriaceae bacterium]